MHLGKKFVAFIPARSGSKRLPKKNIKDLCGKPLVEWTIDAAKNSKYLDKIYVSSDDEKINKISIKKNISILDRPQNLSSDKSKMVDLIDFLIKSIPEDFDYFVLLQPTSPLRNSDHIDEAIETLIEKRGNAIVSLSRAQHTPLWCHPIRKNGRIDSFLPNEIKNAQSQDLKEFFCLNGAIYIVNIEIFLEQKTFFPSKTFPFVMEEKYSIDIDNEFDFAFAEFLISKKNK